MKPGLSAPKFRGNLTSQGAPASGGLASMLDLNGDGNPLDDIMGMIGKVTR